MWRIDPFLGSDSETDKETTLVARQQMLISKNGRPLLRNGSVNMFPHATKEELLETLFSTRFMKMGFKEDN
jgi:hypothetical protein